MLLLATQDSRHRATHSDQAARARPEILYSSRENIRAGHFLTVLADRLTAMKASRVVLDAATQMLTDQVVLDEFRHMLYKLGVRFKTLGITCLFTLESPSLISTDRVTELGLSPIADNLIMLRYAVTEGRLTPTLTIVKTRGRSIVRAGAVRGASA